MDPYRVLGVSSSATDDEIKKAYRDLIKKNHPDKFQDATEKARATEKVKQYNAAYDEIQAIRSGKTGYGSSGGYDYGYSNYEEESTNPKYAQIYAYINSGNIAAAEMLLEKIIERDAEWHYLKGIVYLRRQWFDAAKREFETAMRMNPQNRKYQQAYRSVNNYGGYRNFYGMDDLQNCDPCDICTTMMCADCLCSTLRCC